MEFERSSTNMRLTSLRVAWLVSATVEERKPAIRMNVSGTTTLAWTSTVRDMVEFWVIVTVGVPAKVAPMSPLGKLALR